MRGEFGGGRTSGVDRGKGYDTFGGSRHSVVAFLRLRVPVSRSSVGRRSAAVRACVTGVGREGHAREKGCCIVCIIREETGAPLDRRGRKGGVSGERARRRCGMGCGVEFLQGSRLGPRGGAALNGGGRVCFICCWTGSARASERLDRSSGLQVDRPPWGLCPLCVQWLH